MLSSKEITVVFANVEDLLLTNTVRYCYSSAAVLLNPCSRIRWIAHRLLLAPLKNAKRTVGCTSIRLATYYFHIFPI